ncbi:hypothetical protein EYR40_004789 [Pleurotus pulmonarius]|nr:hypothetical protein EYR40_004789 [Pleurotus pulmonarius]
MQNQPFYDAMLGIPSQQPSQKLRPSGGDFGLLPVTPGASSSTLNHMELAYGAASYSGSGRSQRYQDASSLSNNMSQYDMMHLLQTAPQRTTCRCGGATMSPSYPVHSTPALGHSHYNSFMPSDMDAAAMATIQGDRVHNAYYSSGAPTITNKPAVHDAQYFLPEYSSVQDVPFDAMDNWNDMSAELIASMNQFIPQAELPSLMPPSPYYETSPDTSPSPSDSPRSDHEYFNRLYDSADPSSSHRSSPKPPSAKQCSHCRATSTPLWRREPTTLKPLCNACGLYLQQRNKLRPQELIDADDDEEGPVDPSGDMSGPECSHCHTRQTSVWRRSKTGAQLCNACGVYSRLRGKDRPLSLKRNKIKPRSKHPSK